MNRMDSLSISRRGAILAAALGTLGLTKGPSAADPGRPLRFVHMTDAHVCETEVSQEGYARALRAVRSLRPAPAFIIAGGDHVMDASCCDVGSARRQWRLYRDQTDQASLPVYSVLGNHDAWAWGQAGVADDQPGYGKAMAMDHLRMRSPYYAIDRGGWRLLILDNIVKQGTGYRGDLDWRQYEWLKEQLRSAGTRPVALFSHIPIFSGCVFFEASISGSGDYVVPESLMHRDFRQIIELLKPANVRLVVSGHMHLLEKIEFQGMTFICDGAVCGGWWNGPHLGCAAGMGVYDLSPDGSFRHSYFEYDKA